MPKDERSVTEEMIREGLAALRNRLLAEDPVGAFTDVYLAMRALDPDYVRMRDERDGFQIRCQSEQAYSVRLRAAIEDDIRFFDSIAKNEHWEGTGIANLCSGYAIRRRELLGLEQTQSQAQETSK